MVVATYSLKAVDGGFSVAFAGADTASVCSPFDSCGVNGAIDVTLGKSNGTAGLTAVAPATRPKRDLLTALGLSTAGNPAGVEAFGSVAWESPDGFAVTRVSHADGSECRDRMPIPGGAIELQLARGVARAAFSAEDYGLDPLHSRCAGPLAEDAEAPVATANFPIEIFDRPSVVLDLSRGTSLAGGPFTGSTTSTLRVTLTPLGPPEEFVTG